MKTKTEIIEIIIIATLCIPVALYVGKTTFDNWSIIKIERPITAILVYLSLIACLFES